MDIKVICWQKQENDDNIKHKSMNKDVDFISVPIESNNLSLTEDPYPECLDTLKENLNFRGNIRLSGSGNSYVIWRDELNAEDDMVTIKLVPNLSTK
tara:strand:- start:8514 stop:8804 length:291 start_codon:yes stop_codon:yes gene_type:complete